MNNYSGYVVINIENNITRFYEPVGPVTLNPDHIHSEVCKTTGLLKIVPTTLKGPNISCLQIGVLGIFPPKKTKALLKPTSSSL